MYTYTLHILFLLFTINYAIYGMYVQSLYCNIILIFLFLFVVIRIIILKGLGEWRKNEK